MSNNFTKKSSDLDDLGDLTNDELPRLSEIIKYEEDIKPYRYIQIFSGVGSGKNTLINRFVSGDPEYGIPKKTVLVITSRRSKVDEQLSDEEVSFAAKIGKWGNMGKEIYDDDDKDIKRFKSNIRIIKDEYGEHTIYQESVICTNAFIEKYLQKVYNPEDAGTHLWNLFDMIVIDEFHSLVLDATYQTAPYHVNSLIWEFAHRCQMADMNPDSVEPPLCQHLILMTGTPETVKSLPVPYRESSIIYSASVLKRLIEGFERIKSLPLFKKSNPLFHRNMQIIIFVEIFTYHTQEKIKFGIVGFAHTHFALADIVTFISQ
jgi:hypothetical protein